MLVQKLGNDLESVTWRLLVKVRMSWTALALAQETVSLGVTFEALGPCLANPLQDLWEESPFSCRCRNSLHCDFKEKVKSTEITKRSVGGTSHG